MNPALGGEFRIFCEQEQPQKHLTLDEKSYWYGVYGTLKHSPESMIGRYLDKKDEEQSRALGTRKQMGGERI